MPLKANDLSLPFLKSVTVQAGAVAEGGVALNRHAQAAVDHVGIAFLCAKCFVGHLEARRAVHSAINPHDLKRAQAYTLTYPRI